MLPQDRPVATSETVLPAGNRQGFPRRRTARPRAQARIRRTGTGTTKNPCSTNADCAGIGQGKMPQRIPPPPPVPTRSSAAPPAKNGQKLQAGRQPISGRIPEQGEPAAERICHGTTARTEIAMRPWDRIRCPLSIGKYLAVRDLLGRRPSIGPQSRVGRFPFFLAGSDCSGATLRIFLWFWRMKIGIGDKIASLHAIAYGWKSVVPQFNGNEADRSFRPPAPLRINRRHKCVYCFANCFAVKKPKLGGELLI